VVQVVGCMFSKFKARVQTAVPTQKKNRLSKFISSEAIIVSNIKIFLNLGTRNDSKYFINFVSSSHPSHDWLSNLTSEK
jgi:hypothetical protein